MAENTFRVFISSPGDVAEERQLASRVISRLNREFGGDLEISAFFWEHEPLLASGPYQGQIDQILRPSECDAVVCVLWSRLGTRLPADYRRADGSFYDSGTEVEFEDAIEGRRRRGCPDLLVYRTTAPVTWAVSYTHLSLPTINWV